MAVHSEKARRRFRVIRAFGRYVLNPTMRGLVRVSAVSPAHVSELETVGRKTGQSRRVPVSPIFDETGAWIICGHGTLSGWGANIAANPNVRIQQGDRWRSGVATFVPDDDVDSRVRRAGALGPKIAARGTAPVTVRVEFVEPTGAEATT